MRTVSRERIGGEETNKQKTHKHFSGGPCGTIVPETNPHPSQGQTGQNGEFTEESNRKRPVCPGTGPNLSRGGVPFVPGTVPVCPGRRPAQNVYVYFFLPERRDKKMKEKQKNERPGHPTRQKTGASQKMDRSKKGPPEVSHHEGALGDLWGLILRGFWAVTLVRRFTQRMDLRERSGVTCVNLHFRSVINLRKSLLGHKTYTGVKRAKKWLRQKLR